MDNSIQIGDGPTEEDFRTSEEILAGPEMSALRSELLNSGVLQDYTAFLRSHKPSNKVESAALWFTVTRFAVDLLGIPAALLMEDGREDEGIAGMVEYITAALPEEVKTQKAILAAIIGVKYGEEIIDGDGGTILNAAVGDDTL